MNSTIDCLALLLNSMEKNPNAVSEEFWRRNFCISRNNKMVSYRGNGRSYGIPLLRSLTSSRRTHPNKKPRRLLSRTRGDVLCDTRFTVL